MLGGQKIPFRNRKFLQTKKTRADFLNKYMVQLAMTFQTWYKTAAWEDVLLPTISSSSSSLVSADCHNDICSPSAGSPTASPPHAPALHASLTSAPSGLVGRTASSTPRKPVLRKCQQGRQSWRHAGNGSSQANRSPHRCSLSKTNKDETGKQ